MEIEDFYDLQKWINEVSIGDVEILSKKDAIKFAKKYHEMMIKEHRINNPDSKFPERGVTPKMLKAELYVDEYIEKNGSPPT